MFEYIKEFADLLKEKILKNNVHILSHYDTDGISSAAIISKTLNRLSKQFSLKILKQLTQKEIREIPENKLIIITDLGSNNIEELSKLKNEIFIIDHHEIKIRDLQKNIKILNPHLFDEYEELSSSELVYLVSKYISEENKDLSYLAILGMIGDTLERKISKTREKIIRESNVKVKKGLLIYPSTRPLDKTLEYSLRPFIPGVTGNQKGSYELLKEARIDKVGKNFKSLIDLTDEEMKRLITSVILRIQTKEKNFEYIGNLYLIKLFNKIEDARELSAIINACSRMGKPEISLMLCLGNLNAKKKAERIYIKYRQHIISGLKYILETEKIIGKNYVIINAKDKIKDTLIGTLISIISFSSFYREGTILIGMAYNEDKIKVSARISGKNSETKNNLKEVIESVVELIGGDFGGHREAAGCIIKKEDEKKFIELIKKKLEYEVIKINSS